MPKRKAPTEFDVDRCLTELGDVQDSIKRLISGLTEDQCKTRPDPAKWSIVECLDHLTITGNAFLPIWDDAIEAARAEGKLKPGPYRYGWFSRFFMDQLEPPYSRRMRTTAPFLPAAVRPVHAVVGEYKDMHRAVIIRMNGVRGLDARGIKVVSPFGKWIRYPIGASFDILLAHERRHAWQAAQVAGALLNKAAASGRR